MFTKENVYVYVTFYIRGFNLWIGILRVFDFSIEFMGVRSVY